MALPDSAALLAGAGEWARQQLANYVVPAERTQLAPAPLPECTAYLAGRRLPAGALPLLPNREVVAEGLAHYRARWVCLRHAEGKQSAAPTAVQLDNYGNLLLLPRTTGMRAMYLVRSLQPYGAAQVKLLVAVAQGRLLTRLTRPGPAVAAPCVCCRKAGKGLSSFPGCELAAPLGPHEPSGEDFAQRLCAWAAECFAAWEPAMRDSV